MNTQEGHVLQEQRLSCQTMAMSDWERWLTFLWGHTVGGRIHSGKRAAEPGRPSVIAHSSSAIFP